MTKESKKRKLTDALIVAEADDEAAWGEPVTVPPSKSPRPDDIMNGRPSEEMRPHSDFTGGVQGKYAAEYAQGTNVAVIAPDLAKIFPDSESVNEALRTLVRISGRGARLKKSAKRGA